MKVSTFSFILLAFFVAAYNAEEEEVEILTECPAVDGDYAVHIANPDDCTSFFTCNAGEPILTKCPPGLGYNAKEQVCDWPENVGCEIPPAEEEAEK